MTETVLSKRAEKTSEPITDSYAVSDQHELVEELSKGRWVIYAHEWLPIEADLDDWKQSTAEASAESQRSHWWDAPFPGRCSTTRIGSSSPSSPWPSSPQRATSWTAQRAGGDESDRGS